MVTTRSGETAVTLMIEVALLLPVFDSPVVAMVAVLVIEDGALAAIFATIVITEFVAAARATVREHWTVAPNTQVQFAPVADVTVKPVGMMSCIVIVPVVGPLPLLVTVIA